MQIEIYDATGKRVFSEKLKETEANINADNLSAGIYHLSVFNEHQRYNKKIIIQN